MSGQSGSDTERCGYCDIDELVYELEPMRGGVVHRCIECLAIEQGQKKLQMPFEVWLDRDDIEPPEADDAPDFEPFDPTKQDYYTARAWFSVLARLKDDDPIIKRDPDAIGTIYEDTREFLINLMGSDAHKRPSELRSRDTETDRGDSIETDGGTRSDGGQPPNAPPFDGPDTSPLTAARSLGAGPTSLARAHVKVAQRFADHGAPDIALAVSAFDPDNPREPEAELRRLLDEDTVRGPEARVHLREALQLLVADDGGDDT